MPLFRRLRGNFARISSTFLYDSMVKSQGIRVLLVSVLWWRISPEKHRWLLERAEATAEAIGTANRFILVF